MTTTDVPPTQALALRPIASTALTIQDIIAQKKLVAQCVSELMHENEHYGVIPGTEKTDKEGRDISKRTLLKAGADLLCSLFQLEADYQELEVIRSPTLIYYRLKCTLTSAQSGIRRGSGVGSCNSHEEKYLRAAPKKCPQCGKEAIKRSKFPPRNDPKAEPGWYCFDKIGGCGAQFEAAAAAIAEQEAGIKDPADLDNTILKMAAKRSRVDAVLTVTGASDFFTQDVADLESSEVTYTPPPQKAGADPKAPTSTASQSSGTKPTPSASGTATTSTPKANPAPRANTVKADGTKASPDAVKLLHTLRGKVGGLVVCDQKTPCPYPNGKFCGYHTQLAAFKDTEGKPVRSSKDLSPEQISNLIGRYEKKITEQGMRAEQAPDLGAVIPANGNMSTLEAEISRRNLAPMIIREMVLAPFGVDDVIQLDKEDVPAALAILMAVGTPQYSATVAKATGVPQ